MRTYKFGFIDDNGIHKGVIQAENIVKAVWLIFQEHESEGPVTNLTIQYEPPSLK